MNVCEHKHNMTAGAPAHSLKSRTPSCTCPANVRCTTQAIATALVNDAFARTATCQTSQSRTVTLTYLAVEIEEAHGGADHTVIPVDVLVLACARLPTSSAFMQHSYSIHLRFKQHSRSLDAAFIQQLPCSCACQEPPETDASHRAVIVQSCPHVRMPQGRPYAARITVTAAWHGVQARLPFEVPQPRSTGQQYLTHVSWLHVHISCARSTSRTPGCQGVTQRRNTLVVLTLTFGMPGLGL